MRAAGTSLASGLVDDWACFARMSRGEEGDIHYVLTRKPIGSSTLY
jgi:hypothetical protein